MSDSVVMEWNLGDLVTLHKVHPCGSYQWEVYRMGADIGIRCTTCCRRLLMERRSLEKRARKVTQVSQKHV
jgi:hypothetical protein